MGSPGGQMEQLSGASLEKGALDTTDGHMGVNHASEKLDKQYEKMKVRMLLVLTVLGTPFYPEQVTSTSLLLNPGSTSQFIVFDVSATLPLIIVFLSSRHRFTYWCAFNIVLDLLSSFKIYFPWVV